MRGGKHLLERLTPGTPAWEWHGAEHMQRYQFFGKYCAGKDVLDAACGAGFGSHYLAATGAASVLGVDIAQEAVDYATRQYSHPCLRFALGDAQALDRLNAQFDVIVSFETIEHVPEPAKLVESAYRALKPGGLFICSTPNVYCHSQAEQP